MRKLVLFEIKKLFYRKSTYIVLFLVMLICLLSTILVSKKDNIEYVKYHEEVVLKKRDYSGSDYSVYKSNILEKNKLVKELNSRGNKSKSEDVIENSYVILVFSSIIIIIYASGILLKDVNNSVINNILSRGYSRDKIYAAKLASVVLISLGLLTFILLLTLLFTSIINENVFTTRVMDEYLYIMAIKNYLLLLSSILFLGVLSFSLSILFKSINIVSVVLIFLLITGPMLTDLFLNFDLVFILYTFVPYLDYSIFLDKIELLNYCIFYDVKMDVNIANLVLCIYTILFVFLGRYLFIKKDIRV